MPEVLLIEVQYRIRATNSFYNLVYPLFISEGWRQAAAREAPCRSNCRTWTTGLTKAGLADHGALRNIALSLLAIMGLPKPAEMTGHSRTFQL